MPPKLFGDQLVSGALAINMMVVLLCKARRCVPTSDLLASTDGLPALGKLAVRRARRVDCAATDVV
jgi:hypothetical protein